MGYEPALWGTPGGWLRGGQQGEASAAPAGDEETPKR